jgi:NAD(P) transhydrogenase subunit beta
MLEGSLNHVIQIIYLLCAVGFIVGLKLQSSADSARKGNLVAGYAMGVATIATIVIYGIDAHAGALQFALVIAGIAVGSIIGTYQAKTVKMTAMPEMVSFFNGMGGATAVALSIAEYGGWAAREGSVGGFISLWFGLVIGGIAFTGSMAAYGKLQGKIKDFVLPGQQIINILFIAAMAFMGYLLVQTGNEMYLYGITILSFIYGVLFVMPIGGADMPVVISLLNSFTGLSATFAGLLFGNQAMIIGGILVGSAGTILTVLMCQAMNRSLWNVLVGAFGKSGVSSAQAGEQIHKEANYTDVAIMCYYADKVYIVPGYGMAVAQAQHQVHEIEKILEANGVDVKYAIHPVAGRMPGHMNVLLAEADVAYPKLVEMDDANPEFKNTDVVLVIGANDVVNPAANDDPGSPIYGMPILNVTEAKQTIILKRSMNPGYAGIENPLFFKEKSKMLFGDAKDSLEKLIAELKAL